MSTVLFVFFLYLGVLVMRGLLKALNLNHLRLHGQEIPPEFEGHIQADLLAKTSRYVLETSRMETWESLLDGMVLVFFLFGGLLSGYDTWVNSLSATFHVKGGIFFLGLLYAESLLGVPFSLYRNFVIEKRYGFNTMTLRTWSTDLLKTFLLSSLIGGLLIFGALGLVTWSPKFWWLWVWGFFLTVSIFLMYVSPYVIEPLFFRFEPLRAEGLEDRIRNVLGKAGLKVSRVFQVDASRRSRHSNAYFTGIGRVKRIVLFDTLLEQMNGDEIVAVLAHEAGHWKKRHLLKRLAMTQVLSLAFLYIGFRALQWDGLPALVGLEELSFFGRVVLVGFVGSLLTFPLTPVSTYLSRRHERMADRFAWELTGQPRKLASALVKLAVQNLSNLHPHPLYAWFYYSHPPVVDRVRNLYQGRAGFDNAVST